MDDWLNIGVYHIGWQRGRIGKLRFLCRVCGKKAGACFYSMLDTYTCPRCGLSYRSAGTLVVVSMQSIRECKLKYRRKATDLILEMQREWRESQEWVKRNAPPQETTPAPLPAPEPDAAPTFVNPEEEDEARWAEIELPESHT